MSQVPHDRASLNALMRDLTLQYDTLLAEVTELESTSAASLDAVGLDRLLSAAEDEAKRDLELKTKRVALGSLERRFAAVASQARDIEYAWAREQVDQIQPELDRLAADVVKAFGSAIGKLKKMREISDGLYQDVGLFPDVPVPLSLIETLEHRVQVYEQEQAERLD